MALQVSGSKDGSPGLQGLSLGARADASAYWAWVGWGLLITVLVAKKRVKQKFLPSRAGVAGWQRCTCLAVPCHRPSPSTGRQGAAAGLRLHFNPLWPVLTSEDFVLQYIAMCVGGGVTSGETWNRVRHSRRDGAHHFALACFQLLLLPIPGWERKSPAPPNHHQPPNTG